MRYRLCFPYILALAAALTSTAAAAEEPSLQPPHTWTTVTQAPQSPVSWQSPLLEGSRDALEKSPPAFHLPLSTAAKGDFVARPQEPMGHCSSSYAATACAALIAISAAVQHVRESP